jgi:hypothetical protein
MTTPHFLKKKNKTKGKKLINLIKYKFLMFLIFFNILFKLII